jgi:hypothetical protein
VQSPCGPQSGPAGRACTPLTAAAGPLPASGIQQHRQQQNGNICGCSVAIGKCQGLVTPGQTAVCLSMSY